MAGLKRATDKEINWILQSDYQHIEMGKEMGQLDTLLKGRIDLSGINKISGLKIHPLAKDPLRSLKNNIICVISSVCREAISLGVNERYSYAMSDYYISELENQKNSEQVIELALVMIRHYLDKVREAEVMNYSLCVTKAIRYINNNIYERIRVADIAQSIGVHKNYLSHIFKAEVGMAAAGYIKKRKLEEAETMLKEGELSVREISELLGFGSVSYFCSVFHSAYGVTPLSYKARVVNEKQ